MNNGNTNLNTVIYVNNMLKAHYLIFKDIFDGDMNWFPPRFRKWIKQWIEMPHETVSDLCKISDENKISLKQFSTNQLHCMRTLTIKLQKEFHERQTKIPQFTSMPNPENLVFLSNDDFIDIVKNANRNDIETIIPTLPDFGKLRYMQVLANIYGMDSMLENLSNLDWNNIDDAKVKSCMESITVSATETIKGKIKQLDVVKTQYTIKEKYYTDYFRGWTRLEEVHSNYVIFYWNPGWIGNWFWKVSLTDFEKYFHKERGTTVVKQNTPIRLLPFKMTRI